MRLGCSVRIVGKAGLHSYDGRRGQHAPHLSVSLAHLRAVLDYLASRGITMYRMAPDLAPYATHPDYPELHNQVAECAAELAAVGALIRERDLRVSFHAPSTVALGATDPAVVAAGAAQLGVLAAILDGMALDASAVIVVHTGGLAGGADALVARWLAVWPDLPLAVRRRLALEHDTQASLGVVLRISALTGVPVVFDHHHWLLYNPAGDDLATALGRALATWPVAVTPKAHFATPRTELRAAFTTDARGRRRWHLAPPRAGHHSDFIHPWEFARFIEAAAALRDFDVMLEAKAGDLAVLRLRADLQRYTPAVAALLEIVNV